MPKILLVEDSPTQAEALCFALSEEGFQTIICSSAEEALTTLRTEEADSFDSVLSDVYMPGISGYDFCKTVKADDALKDIPFVLLTARKGTAEIISGLECGADGFLTKPVDPQFVAARLNSLIHNHRSRQAGKFQMGVELSFLGKRFNVTADKEQILNLLISTFEDIHLTNAELERKQEELADAKAKLEDYAKGIEAALDVSQDQLRIRNEAIDALDVAVVLVAGSHADRLVEDVNPAYENITGYSADESLGKPFTFFAGADTDATILADLRYALKNLAAASGLIQCYRKDGRTFWNDIALSPVHDRHGAITHGVILMRDVTERKSLEQQFSQAQKMEVVGQLTGGLAHDFNNLLTVIIGNLDLILEGGRLDAGMQELADLALKASLRGADLTRQLLAFSRRQPLAAEVIQINELIAGTIELLRRTLGERIIIQTDLPKDLWPALADPTQVESALTNLAINARDAMPHGGHLTIEASNRHLDSRYAAENTEVVPGDYIMLAVSDTGSGIPVEILEKVIEPFFTTKVTGEGTGLGLSMVYGFAKQSGGHLKIYSEVGHGTTVRLYLPRAPADANVGQISTAVECDGRSVKDAVILVVEDNADVRKVVVSALAALGYKIFEASDAETGLQILREKETIDLLFTDIVMPGMMTGIELATEARNIRPDIRILFTSGFAAAALQNATRSAELGPLLSKPYRVTDLVRAVQEVLE